MDLKLKGKTALVTGSSEGIGFATAKGLAREGAKVYINGRNKGKLDRAVHAIRGEVSGAEAEGLVADFGKVEDVNSLIVALPEVDILVNNIGVFGMRPFETTDDAQWFKDFEVNVMSGVRLSRHYAPFMRAKNWGRIIFISSESAINVPEDTITYGVTKMAYLALSRGLAKHLKGTNVTVNAVLPGPTMTAVTKKMFETIAKEKHIPVKEAPELFIREHRSSSIIQRFTTPDEVANMIVYLASPLSSATTGAALRADGGVVDASF